MTNRIFFSELLQDIPLWTALIMSVYPDLKNEYIFYISLFIGILSSLYILYMMKKGEYTVDKLFDKPSEAFPFIIYSFSILIFLLYLTVNGKLYMSGFVWGYVILTATGELFLMGRTNPQE